MGARALLLILNTNHTLRRVDLTKNKVGVKYLIQIKLLISKNRDRYGLIQIHIFVLFIPREIYFGNYAIFAYNKNYEFFAVLKKLE